jgi:DivIVA protein
VTTAMHPDRLTPEYLQQVSFPPARLGKRGVDEAYVRVFCEWVEGEITRLLNEKTALEQELWRLRDRVREADASQPEDAHVQAVYILSRAQEMADKYVANAQDFSRDVAADARRRREEIVAEARAGAVVLAAPVPAPEPATPEPAASQRREDLESELAYLRTFSRVCRTHLRAYLESLTRSIDEWEQVEGGAARR